MNDKLSRRDRLAKQALDFTEAFNRNDLDAVMSYFAEDAIYDEFHGARHEGIAAIRTAFEPQFKGVYGRIRFHDEDMFVDADSGKVLIRWLLTLEEDDRQGAYRGLDILHFEHDRLVEKHTYCKAKIPLIRKKAGLEAEGAWPG